MREGLLEVGGCHSFSEPGLALREPKCSGVGAATRFTEILDDLAGVGTKDGQSYP